MKLQVGERSSFERTFTTKDVELFAELSGDKGSHHTSPDSEGRLMVHGLLTATVPTKLGGDINYIAREITYEFLRSAFTGDTARAAFNYQSRKDNLMYRWSSFATTRMERKYCAAMTNGIIRALSSC